MTRLFDLESDPLGGDSAPRTPRPTPAAYSAGPLGRIAVTGLRRRPRLALAVAGLVGAAGVFAVQSRMRPSYRAEGVLEVSAISPRLLYTDEEWRASSITGFYSDHVRTLTNVAKSRAVVRRAVDDLAAREVEWLPEGVPEASAVDHLRARIEINALRDTHLLAIGFTDSDSKLVAPVVESVVDAFLFERRDATEQRRLASLASLADERERLDGELASRHERLDELSDRLGSGVLDSRHNPFYERLNVLEEGMTKLFVERVQAEGALEEARGRAQELTGGLPEGELRRLVDEDVLVKDARVMHERLVREILGEIGELSPDHPEHMQATDRVETADEQLLEIEDAVATRLRERIELERDQQAAELLGAAERRAASARESEALMLAVVEEARVNLREWGRAMSEGSRLQSEVEVISASIQDIDRRSEQLLIESNAEERIHVVDAPVTPLEPAGDRRKLFSIAAVMAGIVAGAVVAIGLELLASRRREPVRVTLAEQPA